MFKYTSKSIFYAKNDIWCYHALFVLSDPSSKMDDAQHLSFQVAEIVEYDGKLGCIEDIAKSFGYDVNYIVDLVTAHTWTIS